MFSEDSRHLIIAKINVITESKKHTVFSETFSHFDMKLKYSLPQEYLDQKNPIIFQIVYSNDVRTYIFNIYGSASSDAPSLVVFAPESLNVVQQFLTDLSTKKKPAAI